MVSLEKLGVVAEFVGSLAALLDLIEAGEIKTSAAAITAVQIGAEAAVPPEVIDALLSLARDGVNLNVDGKLQHLSPEFITALVDIAVDQAAASLDPLDAALASFAEVCGDARTFAASGEEVHEKYTAVMIGHFLAPLSEGWGEVRHVVGTAIGAFESKLLGLGLMEMAATKPTLASMVQDQVAKAAEAFGEARSRMAGISEALESADLQAKQGLFKEASEDVLKCRKETDGLGALLASSISALDEGVLLFIDEAVASSNQTRIHGLVEAMSKRGSVFSSLESHLDLALMSSAQFLAHLQGQDDTDIA